MMMTKNIHTDAVMKSGTTVDDEEIPDDTDLMDIVEIPTLSIECLSNEVISKILVEYVGHFDIGLIALASTSKFWSDIVYRKTPGLWKKIGFHYNGILIYKFENINDDQLRAFLIRINAKDVLENLKLTYCSNITGIGLEPIRGSTVLRQLIMRRFFGPAPPLDVKSLVRTIESLFPFSANNPSNTSFPGPLCLVLPMYIGDSRHDWYIGDRLDWGKLQKLFRDNYTKHKKDCKFLCPKCKNSMQFWFVSCSLNEMSIKTYCTKCHDYKGGMLSGCHSCKRDFDYTKNSAICATCNDTTTCCHDCSKIEGNMEFCSICKIPSCSHCLKLKPSSSQGILVVRKCHDCSITACGICKEGAQCTSYNCETSANWYCDDCWDGKVTACSSCEEMRCDGCLRACASCADRFCICKEHAQCTSHDCETKRKWYCNDCWDGKVTACSSCEEMRCDGCLRACASCADRFCDSTHELYDGRNEGLCAREKLKSCDICLRYFCSKDSCTNVTECNESRCGMSVCEECVEAGTTKEMIHCSCNGQHCDTPGCRTKHVWRCSRFF